MARSPWDEAPFSSAAVPPTGPVQLPPRDGRGHPFDVRQRARYGDGVLIGQGGMGRVECVRDHRLRRDVARKEVLSGLGTDADARLAREAWIVAQLEHPGIVPVYDAGRDPDGSLYYTMRIVRGRSLRERLEDGPDGQALLVHVRDAAHAIAYAHSLGVVHRDLKPDNVLIGEFGETQVVDWGLARTIGEDAWVDAGVPEEHRAHTVRGTVVGTPAYMSPEQATGAGADPRSDVWSLGVMLYEVLAGEPPFAGDSATEVLAQVHARPVPELSGVAAPLAAIVRRALQRDPDQRYPTARELADDLERFYAGKPVLAHHMTATERLWMAARRWQVPVAVGAVGVLALALVAGLGWSRTSAERDRARAAEDEAVRAAEEAERHLARSLIGQATEAQRVGARPEGEVLAAHALAHEASADARGVVAAFGVGPRPRLLSRVDRPAGELLDTDPVGDALLIHERDALTLWSSSTRSKTWSRATAAVFDGVLLPELGRVVVNAGRDRRLLWLDLATGMQTTSPGELASNVGLQGAGRWIATRNTRHVQRLDGGTGHVDRVLACPGAEVSGMVMHEDGRLVVGCNDGSVLVVDAEGQQVRHTSESDVAPIAFTWLPGGSLVYGGLRGQLQRVDAASGERGPLVQGVGGLVRDITASASGWIAVAGERGGVQVRDPVRSTLVARLPVENARMVRFDGDVLVTVGDAVARWRLDPSLGPNRLPGDHGISALSVAPDGSAIASVHGDGSVRVHELPSGRQRFVVRFQERVGKDVAWSADGTWLVASGMGDPGLAWIDAATGEAVTTMRGQKTIRRIGTFADGTAWGVSWGDTPEVWTPPHGEPTQAFALPGEQIGEAEGNDARTAAALLGVYGSVYRWRMGQVPELISRDLEAIAIDVDPAGDDVVVAGRWGIARVGDDGERWRVRLEATPTDVAFTADDRLVAVGTLLGGVLLLDARDGSLVARMAGHDERVSSVAVDPRGRWVASGGWDGDIVFWGLDALSASADAIVAEVESAYGLTLDDALSARVR